MAIMASVADMQDRRRSKEGPTQRWAIPSETDFSAMGDSSVVMVELSMVQSRMGKSKVGPEAGVGGGEEIARMGETPG